MVQIRGMLEDEVEAVRELWSENCAEAVGEGLSADEAARVTSNLRRYVSCSKTLCLVAEERGKLVGFITGCLMPHPVTEGVSGEIEEVYVRAEARRGGTGAELVAQAVSRLRGRGATVIRAYVSTNAPAATRFWQHLGWENDLAVYSLYPEEE